MSRQVRQAADGGSANEDVNCEPSCSELHSVRHTEAMVTTARPLDPQTNESRDQEGATCAHSRVLG